MSNTQEIVLDFDAIAEADVPIKIGAYPVIIKSFVLWPETQEERDARLENENKYPLYKVRAEITDGPAAGKPLFGGFTIDPRPLESGEGQKNFMLYNFLKALGLAGHGNGKPRIVAEEIINREMTWIIVKDKKNADPEATQVGGFAKAK